MLTIRKLSILGFIICVSAIAGAIILDRSYTLSPCPMCMLQRVIYACLGCVFLIGAIFNFKSIFRYIYAGIVLLFSALGFAVASKQFWLQYFAPPQKTSCSAGLERLIEIYPMLDALKIALNGSPECSRIDFTILTISIAGWSVIIFGLFIILTLYAMYALRKS